MREKLREKVRKSHQKTGKIRGKRQEKRENLERPESKKIKKTYAIRPPRFGKPGAGRFGSSIHISGRNI